MPYCPECGNKVSEDARFCGACGSPIAGGAAAAKPNEPAKKASLLTPARIAIGAAIVLVLGLVVVLVVRRSGESASSAKSSPGSGSALVVDGSSSAKDPKTSGVGIDDATTKDKSAANASATIEGDSWSLALPAYWTDKVTVKKESSESGIYYNVYPTGQETYPVVSVFTTDDPKEEKSTSDTVTLKDGTTAKIVIPAGISYRFSVPLGDGKYVAVQTPQAYAEVSSNRWKGVSQEQVKQMGDLQSQGKAQYSNDASDTSIPYKCLQDLASALSVTPKGGGTANSGSASASSSSAKAPESSSSSASVSAEQEAINLIQGWWSSAGGIMNGMNRTSVCIEGNTFTGYSYADLQGSGTIDPSRVERMQIQGSDGWYFHDLNRFLPDSDQGQLMCINADGSGYSGTDSWGKLQDKPSYLP